MQCCIFSFFRHVLSQDKEVPAKIRATKIVFENAAADGRIIDIVMFGKLTVRTVFLQTQIEQFFKKH